MVHCGWDGCARRVTTADMSSKLRQRLSALLLSLPRAMATEADSAAKRLLLQHVFGLLRLLHV